MLIKLKNVNFTYHNGVRNSGLKNINLTIPKGQVLLLCGESGCGKTTITRLINGLVPAYYEGELTGEIYLNKKNIPNVPLYELAPHIGSVFQNPKSQFFTVTTDTEIVFACENLGISRENIMQSFTQAVADFNIEKLLGRSLFTLSGGEKQKIACASVSTLHPDVFVLDEPSSNLDIAAIEDLKAILAHWKARGKTIIIAEHRLYWLKNIADRVIYMEHGCITKDIAMCDFKKLSLNNLHNMGLRSLDNNFTLNIPKLTSKEDYQLLDFTFSYEKEKIINIPHLTIPKGSVVGIIGNNGAGKTTFARCLCGLQKKATGILKLKNINYKAKDRIKLCYMVMQDVNHQLFTETVIDEILLSMQQQNLEHKEKRAEKILRQLNILDFKDAHPMSLSGGQKQRVVIASAVASNKEILVFDEPTSGLDYRSMLEVAGNIKVLNNLGKTQLIITHDPEFIAQCCNYLIFIENGEVSWFGNFNEDNSKRMIDFFQKVYNL